MADLTRDATLRFRRPALSKVERWPLDTSAAQAVYKGHPMLLDMSVDTTHAVTWNFGDVWLAGDVFLGVALHSAAVVLGATEDTEVDIMMEGEVGFRNITGLTDADVGKPAYFSDSEIVVVAAGGGANLPIGNVQRIEDGYVYVGLVGPDVLA